MAAVPGSEVSPLMRALNAEALSRARRVLSKKFEEAAALDELGALRAELQGKLSAAEAKLKGAVQGKLDSLKSAVDLMEESSSKLSELSLKIDSTEGRIALTDTTISDYPNVKRAHFARDNINKVISEVEFFTKIPDTVTRLRTILDDEPHRIKEVYLKSLELQAWRSALLNELLVSTSAEGKGLGPGYQKRISLTKAKSARARSSTHWEDYSTDMRGRIMQSVGSHLEIVLELSKEIKQRLWSNIERLSDVAARSPSDLVTIFEVIEMHQQYVDRRMERARARRRLEEKKRREAGDTDFIPWDEEKEPIQAAELGGGLENNSNEMMGVTMKQETLERLVRNLNEKVEASFVGIAAELQALDEEEGGEEETDQGVHAHDAQTHDQCQVTKKKNMGKQVTLTLNTATRMIGTMVEFKNVVCVCVPPSYHAMSLYMDAFEQTLLPQIEELVQDLTVLEVSELMQLIDWLEYYVHQAGVFDEEHHDQLPEQLEEQQVAEMRECCRVFLSIAEELMNEYLYRIKKQVMEWFGNIKKQPLEVGKAGDGTLITSMPEDMFNVIHMQMSVARDKLAKEHLKDVVNACMQVLREVQRQSYDSLAAQWSSMDPESLCATVNDMQRMQEKCDEFAHEVMSLVPQEVDRQFLIDMLDSVSTEYVNLALKATTFLSRLVLKDLEEDVFNHLFSVAWESTRDKGESVCGILTATFKDYFIDIGEWLPPYFFHKFIRDALTNTVLQYTMGLRKVAVNSFQFNSELAAARNLISDMEILHEFFVGHLELLAKAGLGTTNVNNSLAGRETDDASELAAKALEDELLPIMNLARLVSATHISGAIADAKALCIRWGREGLRLVLCCISANPSMDKAEKQENSDIAQKTFDQVIEAGLLPRNSPTIAAALEFLGESSADGKADLMGSVVDGLKDGLKRTGSTLRKTNWGKMRGLVSSNRDLLAGMK